MKIWLSEELHNWAGLHFKEPQWSEPGDCWPDGPSGWWTGHTETLELTWARALHRALTGEPLPPWPLLSEIEITEEGAGIYLGGDGARRVWHTAAAHRQTRVWCPGECEVPRGWEEE